MAIFRVPAEFMYSETAGEDFTGDLNKIVALNQQQKLVLAGNGALAIGTLYEEAVADEPATIQMLGIAKVKLGGTVQAGQRVMSNASGLGVAATSALYSIGVALVAGVSGDVIPVTLIPGTVA